MATNGIMARRSFHWIAGKKSQLKRAPDLETGVLQEKQIGNVAADALAHCITRLSAGMVLGIQDSYTIGREYHRE